MIDARIVYLSASDSAALTAGRTTGVYGVRQDLAVEGSY